jgi:hypothetical protein
MRTQSWSLQHANDKNSPTEAPAMHQPCITTAGQNHEFDILAHDGEILVVVEDKTKNLHINVTSKILYKI